MGARVVIHQSTKPVLVGVSGLIISQSAKTFRLLHDRYRPPKEQPDGGKGTTTEAKPPTEERTNRGTAHKPRLTAQYLATHRVIKVPRSEVTLAIHLPQAHVNRNAQNCEEQEGQAQEESGNESDKNGQDDTASPDAQESEDMDVVVDSGQSQADWLHQIARRESQGKVMLLHGLHFAPYSRRVK